MISCPGVSRHFVKVGDRRVHYRKAGRGPVLLMLHQSPKSSREYEALMVEWGRHFTCIAPDTAGYGFSAPLQIDHPELTDFADATCAFMDALKMRKALVYGLHTGGTIAFLLARRHPERVAAVAANGFAILTAAERADILAHYLPPFAPAWDGSHLAWLWARLREQVIFFPWHDRRAAARMNYDMSPPEALHENALELLHAGDHYRTAYGAVFRVKKEDILAGIRTPALIVAHVKDPLHAHLARLPALPENCRAVSMPTPEAARDEALEFLRGHAGQSDAAVADIALGYVALEGGQLRMRMPVGGDGKPLLLLHDITENGDLVDRAVGAGRPLLIPDLPGHGLSDSFGGAVDVGRAATLLGAALDGLGVDEVDIHAQGFGAFVAVEMKHRAARRIGRVAASGLHVPPGDRWAEMARCYVPECKPNAHGGHLLEAWLMVRNRQLFRPWYDQSEAAIIAGEPVLSPEFLQERLVALLDCAPVSRHLFQTMADYPLRERCREMGLQFAGD